MSHKVFATAINCIDGRVQVPVIDWIKKQHGIDYVDMITSPGPERLLAKGTDHSAIQSIKKFLGISVSRHQSKLVAIAMHHDCAGNSAEDKTRAEQMLMAIKTLHSWDYNVKVIGLRVDENWEVHEVQ
ncbi:MAG: hypothetical protein HN929_07565 [Chloroflexi bacterium]|jgi:hypothetical protein|nr:hypothetical protein [Chloroflexota bacterium]MBT7081307.1 hypothetical protein [Chloroflexota bacterium]MBT7290402.1 hypothetical protein [Chloroflexota bacterium]